MIIKNRPGLSLVELLVVIVIISILAALVLPSFKNVLSERKTNVAALEVKSFLEAARARAIARGRNVSVIFERLSSRGDGFGIDGTGITLTNPPRSITAQNPQTGTLSQNAVFASSDAFLNYSQYNTSVRMMMAETLRPTEYEITAPGGIATGIFNQFQSIQFTNNDQRLRQDLTAGNIIEFIFSGGSSQKFVIQELASTTPPYRIHVFNSGSTSQPFGLPINVDVIANSQQTWRPFIDISKALSFRVYQAPIPIASVTNELPKGTCIDLSISGLSGDDANVNRSVSFPSGQAIPSEFRTFRDCQKQFSSDWIMPPLLGGPPTPQQLRPVVITFSATGSLHSIRCNIPQDFERPFPANSREINASNIESNQDVFLFVGRTDQVVLPLDSTNNALTALGIAQRVDEGAKPNMLDPTGYWVRISATNGSIAAAPTQAWHVEQDVAEARNNPTNADDLGEMITESRALTFQSELSSQ